MANLAENTSEDKKMHTVDFDSVFDSYYVQLWKFFCETIKKDIGGEIPELASEFRNAFIAQMRQITLRVCIFEMHICEKCGELQGNSAEARYQYYLEEYLQNPEYLQEIYEEYPLMYQAVCRVIDNSVRNIRELLERFDSDREQINQSFFAKNLCRKIRWIGGGTSDSHQNGHRVYILELDNGEKLVYKPRSLAIDQAYREFAAWVFAGAETSFYWNNVLDKGEYGWCDWVELKPCDSRAELQRYYRRNGILLCVSYLLGSEDIHYENLIACGEYPVIIDLEMAVGSSTIDNIRVQRNRTETERIFLESVLQKGLLPLYTWNEKGEGVNVGTINGRGGQLLPVVVPAVAEPGTTNMHIEYRRPALSEGKNLATLKGVFIEPNEFLTEIEEGFQTTYRFLLQNKEETDKRLNAFRQAKIRYLVRDTQQYGMLLSLSYYPDCLTSEAERRRVWEKWFADENKGNSEIERWIQKQEMAEWERNDIPYFYYEAGGRDLYSGTGESWKDFFSAPALSEVKNRLSRMSEEDLQRQSKLIRAALLMGTKKWNNPDFEMRMLTDEKVSSVEMSKLEKELEEKGIAAAEKIGDLLLEEAIWSENKQTVGWISIIVAGYRERSYLIRPMGYYLYDGLAGVALFFAALEKKTNKTRYREMKKVLIQMLFAYTDELYSMPKTEARPSGAYSGEASIAFAYLLLYALEKDQEYLTYLYRQCKSASFYLADDTNYDVLEGNAGAVLVFLAAYKLTEREDYLEWARNAGNFLLEAAEVDEKGMYWRNGSTETPLTGFAHGSAGIMLALTRLGYETGENKYQEAAYRTYLWEERYYQADKGDWADLRSEELQRQEIQSMAWCHGWGGIVMARLAALLYAKGKWKKILEDSLERFFNEKKAYYIDRSKCCLCHGMMGNAAIFYGVGRKREALYWKNEVIRKISQETEDFQERLELQECENFGVMGGIAGIGYGCLVNINNILTLINVYTI